jgi:hypothetical protein
MHAAIPAIIALWRFAHGAAPAASWRSISTIGRTRLLMFARVRHLPIPNRCGRRLKLWQYRECVLRNVRLRLLVLIVVLWPLAGATLLEGPLGRETVTLLIFHAAIELALERLLRMEPAAAVHSAALSLNTRHAGVLRLRSHDYAIVMLGVLQIVLGTHHVT